MTNSISCIKPQFIIYFTSQESLVHPIPASPCKCIIIGRIIFYNQVPRQECTDVAREQCRDEPRQVEKQECFKVTFELQSLILFLCLHLYFFPTQVPREQCSPITKQVPREECKVMIINIIAKILITFFSPQRVERQECRDVPRQVPKQVERKVCNDIPRQVIN